MVPRQETAMDALTGRAPEAPWLVTPVPRKTRETALTPPPPHVTDCFSTTYVSKHTTAEYRCNADITVTPPHNRQRPCRQRARYAPKFTFILYPRAATQIRPYRPVSAVGVGLCARPRCLSGADGNIYAKSLFHINIINQKWRFL